MARSVDFSEASVAFGPSGRSWPAHPGGLGKRKRRRPDHPWAAGRSEALPLLDPSILDELRRDIEPGAMASILVEFVEDLRFRLHRIAAATQAASQADNLHTLAFESHAMSSCSHTFGALRLARVCRGIERAVDHGCDDEALALARSLTRIGDETLVALSAAAGPSPDANPGSGSSPGFS